MSIHPFNCSSPLGDNHVPRRFVRLHPVWAKECCCSTIRLHAFLPLFQCSCHFSKEELRIFGSGQWVLNVEVGSHLGFSGLDLQGLRRGTVATSDGRAGQSTTGSDFGPSGVSVLLFPPGGGNLLGCRGPSQPPGVALQAAGCWAGASQGHGRRLGCVWGAPNSGGARGSWMGGV